MSLALEHVFGGREIRDERCFIAGVPVRTLCLDTPERAAERGTVLFSHGLGAAIDAQTPELYALAGRGFLVVGLDNAHHGRRLAPDFAERFAPGAGFGRRFTDAVWDTATDIPRLIDALLSRGWACPGAIGLAGISMGGYVTYAAASIEPRLNAIAPILGSPRWTFDKPPSPHRRPEAFFPKAILCQTAGADESVPPRFARQFHEELLAGPYAGAQERLAYLEFPGCPHAMPRGPWIALWTGVLFWFERFLIPE